MTRQPAIKFASKARRAAPEAALQSQEKWRPVLCHEDMYEVSSSGRVRSITRIVPHARYGSICRKSVLRKPRVSRCGYLRVSLHKQGEQTGKYKAVHRLVALAFIPRLDLSRHQINHIDGNKTNNHVCNLEWVTASENIKHAWLSGLCKPMRGEKSSRAKLTEVDIVAIRNDPRKQRDIAADYHVDQAHISAIKLRKFWAHVS